MKTIATLVLAAAVLVGCKSDQGRHLGEFTNWCESQNGVLTKVTNVDYECKIGDVVYRTRVK